LEEPARRACERGCGSDVEVDVDDDVVGAGEGRDIGGRNPPGSGGGEAMIFVLFADDTTVCILPEYHVLLSSSQSSIAREGCQMRHVVSLNQPRSCDLQLLPEFGFCYLIYSPFNVK